MCMSLPLERCDGFVILKTPYFENDAYVIDKCGIQSFVVHSDSLMRHIKSILFKMRCVREQHYSCREDEDEAFIFSGIFKG